jgi:hypothetical protein
MFCAQDIVYHLLTTTGGGAQDGEHHAIRGAVLHGVREVLQVRDWLWHTKTGSITTNEVSTTATSTGIVAGQYTITVADATGFEVGRLVYVDPGYFDLAIRVVSKNGNVITVDRPAAFSKASTTPVTVRCQTFYDLPANLKDIDALVSNVVGTLHCFLSPQEWQRLEINTRGAGEPYYYTIMRSDTAPDRYQIRFVGVPIGGTVLHYTYRYRPDDIRLMGYEQPCRKGVVTVGGDGLTVTGSFVSPATVTEVSFPTSIVGSVIRFGTATTDADPLGSLYPFERERLIESRTSDTVLVVGEALAARTNVRYAISDLIDCSPQMYTAILSAAEMWYARLAGRSAKDAVALFNRDLRLAMEADVVSPMSGRPRHLDFPTFRSMGWKSAQLPDTL